MATGSTTAWAESVVGRMDGRDVGDIARGLVQRVGLLQGGQQRQAQAADPRVVQLAGAGLVNKSPPLSSRGEEPQTQEEFQSATTDWKEDEVEQLLPSRDIADLRAESADADDFWAEFGPQGDVGAEGNEDGWRGLVRKAGQAVTPLYENAVEVAQSTASAAVEVAHSTASAAKAAAQQAAQQAQQADGSKIAAGAAALGQQVLEAAMSPLHPPGARDGSGPSRPPPPRLKQGKAEVPSPATEREWAECLRDLERMLQGDGVYVAGQHRLSPVTASDRVAGDVGREARAAAFDELLQAINSELEAQGTHGGESPASRLDATACECVNAGCTRPSWNGESGQPCCRTCGANNGRFHGPDCERKAEMKKLFTVSDKDSIASQARSPKPKQKVRSRQNSDAELPGALSAGVLRELTRRVAAHLSVGPGMQVAMQNSLPPALWQPTFLLCIGGAQVRVLTFAFVGEPVTGDRPDCKCTPFVLRLVTEDLLPGAKQAAAGIPTPWRASVRCHAEQSAEGVRSMLEHIASVEEDLFRSAESCNWSRFLGEETDKDVVGPPVTRGTSKTSFASATYGLGGL